MVSPHFPFPPSSFFVCSREWGRLIKVWYSPGRFFAANELKTMMAYLVLNYDVKFAEEGKRPANIRFGPADLPSHSAQVLFRKRRPTVAAAAVA